MEILYTSVTDLNQRLSTSLSFSPLLSIINQQQLRKEDIDIIIYNAQFSPDDQVRTYSRSLIYQLSTLCQIVPSSMQTIYHAFATKELVNFTTPALNIRTLTYDTARLVFRLMIAKQIGAVVFEISPTEMAYTNQSPEEYAVSVLAAAIKEGYQGSVFLQGDHFQFDKDAFALDQTAETQRLKTLIATAIDAKFYNIDIDASTLVDLTKPVLADQQFLNARMTAFLSEYIRSLQPKNQTISIGAEIGHIGDKNSTSDDLKAFMNHYQKLITQEGISKVSVQTGSKHGGTLLPDGSLKPVVLDFSILRDISALARNEYHFGGAVQHGASTLPDSDFDTFVKNQTLEVHIATGLQNIVYENLPENIAKELAAWTLAQKPTMSTDTDEQFIYKTRKKALGQFEKQLWDIDDNHKEKIIKKLEEHLLVIFEKLKIFNTTGAIKKYV